MAGIFKGPSRAAGKEPRTDGRQSKNPGGGNRGNPQQVPQRPWSWWPILIAFLIWDLVLFWPRSKTEVSIPYSAFLAELRTDNVTRVHIVGASITGAFAKPVLWPEQKKSQASEQGSASKTASPTPSATKAQQHSTPAHPFSAFETTFPATVGDPNLMALLESHHVLVDVSPPSTPWLLNLLVDWAPMLLLIAFFWWMSAKASRAQSGLFNIGRIKARRYSSDRPEITFNDVAGANEAKMGIAGGGGFPKATEEVPRPGSAHSEGGSARGPTRNRQNAAGEGCGR